MAGDPTATAAFVVEEVKLRTGAKLPLGPDDQAFYAGLHRDGQYGTWYTFVVLRRVAPDAD